MRHSPAVRKQEGQRNGEDTTCSLHCIILELRLFLKKTFILQLDKMHFHPRKPKLRLPNSSSSLGYSKRQIHYYTFVTHWPNKVRQCGLWNKRGGHGADCLYRPHFKYKNAAVGHTLNSCSLPPGRKALGCHQDLCLRPWYRPARIYCPGQLCFLVRLSEPRGLRRNFSVGRGKADNEKVGNQGRLFPQVRAEYLGLFRPFLPNNMAHDLLPF